MVCPTSAENSLDRTLTLCAWNLVVEYGAPPLLPKQFTSPASYPDNAYSNGPTMPSSLSLLKRPNFVPIIVPARSMTTVKGNAPCIFPAA